MRHSSDREPPFAINVGLLLYAKTRKRQLIDALFQHGICISYDRVLEISTQLGESKAISCLPESYTNVKPAFLKSKPSPPILNTPLVIPDHDYLFRNLRLEYEWLNFVSLTNEVLDVETVSWSAYHSSKRRGPQVNVSISSLLPLL